MTCSLNAASYDNRFLLHAVAISDRCDYTAGYRSRHHVTYWSTFGREMAAAGVLY